ncbi:hypothetical protein GCK72_007253 [Caenorhabditis remanei]|uniref:DUF38 domain-containing protein n=1 Tax=Caenorhabditis remanei TaxID=31234 RepID=A0A6A5HL12_CAERE|nr:hypothetical protein GCK72_007253 [Caenorhabditis remanei]KAF1767294.1 hypothetical protein GCK72_007253 [Caenorhabditis remanei]
MTALTYLSLRCVLEYLEANRRLQIAARNRALSRIDKSVPFHISLLRFTDDEIEVNDISYTFGERHFFVPETPENMRKKIKRLMDDGDILLEDDDILRRVIHITYSTGNLRFNDRDLPDGVKKGVAMRQFACHVLEGRKTIKMTYLRIDNTFEKELRVPENLKLYVQKVRSYGTNTINLVNILDSQCLPLESFETSVWFPSYYRENQIVANAKTLILHGDGFASQIIDWHPTLLTVSNQHVETKDIRLKGAQIREIVQKFMNDPDFKPIGSSYSVQYLYDLSIEKLLRKTKNRFNGVFVTLKEIPKCPPTSQVVCVPLNSDKDLIMYRYAGRQVNSRWIKLELRETGSCIPNVEDTTRFRIPWQYLL